MELTVFFFKSALLFCTQYNINEAIYCKKYIYIYINIKNKAYQIVWLLQGTLCPYSFCPCTFKFILLPVCLAKLLVSLAFTLSKQTMRMMRYQKPATCHHDCNQSSEDHSTAGPLGGKRDTKGRLIYHCIGHVTDGSVQ